MKPGPNNSITDVPGIAVGNAEDAAVRSGVTVVLPDQPAVASVDVRGGGTGTRELALLEPEGAVEHIHALTLAGGSAFGLDAASGVMSWLAAQGRGFTVGAAVVPIVPAAILFDLNNGGDKSAFSEASGDDLPYRTLGRMAAKGAGTDFALGNAGAGLGATAGPLKGGLGSASFVLDDGVFVGALAAVNAAGSAVMPGSDRFWAWPFERNGEFGGKGPPDRLPDDLRYDFANPRMARPGTNTTLAVVATDLSLTKTQARRVAIMAQNGLARALRPVHTPLDGDIVFTLSTGMRELENPVADLARLGTAAADCLARAVARGVYEAQSLGDMRSYRDVFG
ncbi:MAG: P1 family peptidase [Alphaproteobacteria bacterium]|nr:P1 family peptidase [Alphaproteobacteria bacterium]